jgi:hypothetical protein
VNLLFQSVELDILILIRSPAGDGEIPPSFQDNQMQCSMPSLWQFLHWRLWAKPCGSLEFFLPPHERHVQVLAARFRILRWVAVPGSQNVW